MDYTRYAVQEHMKELHMLQQHEVSQMMYEAEFLESCYETGIIGVLEATKDNLFKSLIDAIKEFFANMKSKFRQRSIALYDKKFDEEVIKALRENLGTLQSNAKKLTARKIVPFWKADTNAQQNAVVSAVTDAIRNISTDNMKDYTYAKGILGNGGKDMLRNQDTAMSEYLKNYFRYGGVGDAETKRETVSGSDIAGLLDNMITYIAKYTQEYTPKPGKLSDKLTTILDRLDKIRNGGGDSEASTESLSPYTYLSVEEKYVCETLLPIMVNYSDVVTEKEIDLGEPKNKSNSTTSNDKAFKEVKKYQKEVDDAKEKAKENGESVTKATPVDPKADEQQKEEAKKEETVTISSDYVNSLNYFVKMAVSAYQTSIEERYLLYVDVLEECGASEYTKKSSSSTSDNGTTNTQTQQQTAEDKPKKKGLFGRNKNKNK